MRMGDPANLNKHNIFDVNLPYHLLSEISDNDEKDKWVIFWGANYKDLPNVNEKEFILQTNRCLDYIRRECQGCRLLYKPHPAETNEPNEIDLRGFEITKERTVSEFFMLKNYSKIKYVFSACSGASRTAITLGLNAYIFLPIFESAVALNTWQGYKWYFQEMNPDFFISDLSLPLRENKIAIIRDQLLTDNIFKILNQKKGIVWFIVGDPGLLDAIISIVFLIRTI